MATERLATGSTVTSSSEFTLTADTLVSLKGATAGSKLDVLLKDDAGAFTVIGALTQDKPGGIFAAGTYRLDRPAGSTCGAFSA